MKGKLLILGAVVAALFVGGLATAWLAGAGPFAKQHAQAIQARDVDGDVVLKNADARFVTLDKVIVMLNEPDTFHSRYLSLDLVFQTDAKHEKQVKEQLPLLRSTAYHVLAPYSTQAIRGMDVDQLTGVLQDAYAKAYGGTRELPFSHVQIAKQMIE
jgi:flagellar protein FliL